MLKTKGNIMRATGQFVAVVAVILVPAFALAQTSELYLTTYEQTDAYVVQNSQIIRQFNRLHQFDGPALVVLESIKMLGQFGGQVGHEYDLNGNPLAGTYPNPGWTDCYDGATDGVHNWTIAHNHFPNFPLLVSDADWANIQEAFTPLRRSSGVTYDASTGTLWVTNTVGDSDRVQQYDLNGNVLFEFPVSIPGGYAIAWDPADDTLWIPGSWGTNHLFQYDKLGNLLQEVDVPGLSDRVLGAEFQIPEPTSGALIVLGLGGLAVYRRRRT
jgi:hypothetical protein